MVSTATLRRRLAACVVLGAAIAACEKPLTGPHNKVTLDSWQAPGFYWLPPVVKTRPSFSGTFDPALTTLNPQVAICDVTNGPDADCGGSGNGATPPVALFTTTTHPAITIDATVPQYQVTWPQGSGLVADHVYRMHVTAGTPGTRREIGYDDVLFTTASSLPIHFRIETGMFGGVTVSAATPTVNTGGADQITATVLDLHGAALSGAAVTWTVATTPTSGVVDATQPINPTSGATGASGTTTTMLRAGNIEGTATVTGATAQGSANAVVTVRHVSVPSFYVANSANAGAGASVMAFPEGASGHATPTLTISGPATGLSDPYGVAHDAQGNLYVTNLAAASVTVYAAGASGNAAPTATIAGTATGLVNPVGIALDGVGNIYVADYSASAVMVFAPGASGNATPKAVISGAATELSRPAGIALDVSGQLYVANFGDNSVRVFAAGASGNVSPVATLQGSSTGLSEPFGITLAANQLYVANQTGGPSGVGSVTVYPLTASGNVTPTATIAGTTNTTLDFPAGVAVDASGLIYVANFSSSVITVYAAHANGDVSPTATITGLTNPALISF